LITPYYLQQLNEELKTKFPLPSDYAYRQEDSALTILDEIRRNGGSFAEISVSDLHYAYQLTKFCTEEEFTELKKVFTLRMTSYLFEIGWIYFQVHCDQERAVALFSASCQWMAKNKKETFQKTYIGQVGLPLETIYARSMELLRIHKLTIGEFCEQYSILTDTLFFRQLQITFLAGCEKEELVKNEALFCELILSSDIDFLRPAIKNYTAKFSYQEMPQLISDAITFRLSAESANETLGLSPNMLQHIRSLRFSSLLEGCVNKSGEKLSFYNSVAGMMKHVELLNASFFAIDFGIYVVLDSGDWPDYAFAYIPQIYKPLFEAWKSNGYPEAYWPAMQETEIADAREMILGLKKKNVVRLGFSEFDRLYSKDLLTIIRY